MGSEVNEALRRRVAERAYRVCEYCLVHEEDVYHGCEVDHIRSVKHGGLTVEENLALACFLQSAQGHGPRLCQRAHGNFGTLL